MSPDHGSHAGPSPHWRIVRRGSFVFGQCDVCGYRGPGRRAAYSAESDMRAHEVLCHSLVVADLEREPIGEVPAGT